MPPATPIGLARKLLLALVLTPIMVGWVVGGLGVEREAGSLFAVCAISLLATTARFGANSGMASRSTTTDTDLTRAIFASETVGLQNMADRMGELGGVLRLGSWKGNARFGRDTACAGKLNAPMSLPQTNAVKPAGDLAVRVFRYLFVGTLTRSSIAVEG